MGGLGVRCVMSTLKLSGVEFLEVDKDVSFIVFTRPVFTSSILVVLEGDVLYFRR